MRRASVLLLAFGAACATPAPPPDAAPAAPPPELGTSLGPLLDALDAAPGPGASLALRTLELRRASVDPWEPVGREAAAGETGRLAVVAARRCTTGPFLRRTRRDAVSWYLLEATRLVAYDHAAFDGACRVRRAFAPASGASLATERTLVRFVAQRHPAAQLDAGDELRLGLALARAGRLEDAEARLASADRTLDDLAHRIRRGTEEERAAATARDEELRVLRARLVRALREAQREASPQSGS